MGPWRRAFAPAPAWRLAPSRPSSPSLSITRRAWSPHSAPGRRARRRSELYTDSVFGSCHELAPGPASGLALAAAPGRVQRAEAAAGAPNIYGARWSQEDTLVASHLEPGKLLMCGWSVAVRLGRQAPLLTGPFPGLCRRYSPCNTPQTWPAPVGKRHQSVSSGRGAFGRE
eukprot:scaffold7119_cov129-Isochrysis_galbana.AAC.5